MVLIFICVYVIMYVLMYVAMCAQMSTEVREGNIPLGLIVTGNHEAPDMNDGNRTQVLYKIKKYS